MREIPYPIYPLDGVAQKVKDLLSSYISRQFQRSSLNLSEVMKELILSYWFQMSQQIDNNLRHLYYKIFDQCKDSLKGPPITIEVPLRDIRQSSSSQIKPILAKATVYRPSRKDYLSVDCYVACSHWGVLKDLRGETFNLIDHLKKLLPSPSEKKYQDAPIGVVTYQNGINNTLDDFYKISVSIVDKLPRGLLSIGLHNPTRGGALMDIPRFEDEIKENPHAVYSVCQMINTLATIVPSINPNMTWVHLAHSEAGLIANTSLNACQEVWLKNSQDFVKQRLVTATYGAVNPIFNEGVKEAINTYSDQDIALFFGQPYFDQKISKIEKRPYTCKTKHGDKSYTVTLVKSLLSKKDYIQKLTFEIPTKLTLQERLKRPSLEWVGLAQIERSRVLGTLGAHAANKVIDKVNDIIYSIDDHGFTKDTYQAVLKSNIRDLQQQYQFYEVKNHF